MESKYKALYSKSISNSLCKAIFGPPTAIVHAPAASLNTQILQFFFGFVTVILLI